jgi:hypothetical protein
LAAAFEKSVAAYKPGVTKIGPTLLRGAALPIAFSRCRHKIAVEKATLKRLNKHVSLAAVSCLHSYLESFLTRFGNSLDSQKSHPAPQYHHRGQNSRQREIALQGRQSLI